MNRLEAELAVLERQAAATRALLDPEVSEPLRRWAREHPTLPDATKAEIEALWAPVEAWARARGLDALLADHPSTH